MGLTVCYNTVIISYIVRCWHYITISFQIVYSQIISQPCEYKYVKLYCTWHLTPLIKQVYLSKYLSPLKNHHNRLLYSISFVLFLVGQQ